MIRRRQDWPGRLHEVLAGARRKPFAWGEHDCCLLVADVLNAMCGSAIAAEWRGRYRTARGAAGLLRRRGGFPAVMARLGCIPVSVALARRGDVVELPAPEGGAGVIAGICVGATVAGASEAGWWGVPLRRGIAAWHVPFGTAA